MKQQTLLAHHALNRLVAQYIVLLFALTLEPFVKNHMLRLHIQHPRSYIAHIMLISIRQASITIIRDPHVLPVQIDCDWKGH